MIKDSAAQETTEGHREDTENRRDERDSVALCG